MVRYFELQQEAGARIDAIEADSPAAAAGLRVGDVIVALDDSPVHGIDDLQRLLTGGLIGDGVDIVVLRRDKRLTLRVIPRESARSAARR